MGGAACDFSHPECGTGQDGFRLPRSHLLARRGDGRVLSLAPWPHRPPAVGEDGRDRGRREQRRKQTQPSSVRRGAADERRSRTARREGPRKMHFLGNRPLTCSHLKDSAPRPSHPKMVAGPEGLGRHVTAYTSLWSGVKTEMPASVIMCFLPPDRSKGARSGLLQGIHHAKNRNS